MKRRVWYPKEKDIIHFNKEVLSIHKETKAERHEMGGASRKELQKALKSARAKKGDVEDKAAVLMRRITELHPFGSANRRTAFYSANKMIACNKGYHLAKKREKQAKFLKRVRDREVKDKEIARWLGKC